MFAIKLSCEIRIEFEFMSSMNPAEWDIKVLSTEVAIEVNVFKLLRSSKLRRTDRMKLSLVME